LGTRQPEESQGEKKSFGLNIEGKKTPYPNEDTDGVYDPRGQRLLRAKNIQGPVDKPTPTAKTKLLLAKAPKRAKTKATGSTGFPPMT